MADGDDVTLKATDLASRGVGKDSTRNAKPITYTDDGADRRVDVDAARGLTEEVINNTATFTATDYPTVAGDNIVLYLVHNLGRKTIQVSDDGGTSYKKIRAQDILVWELKTVEAVTQLKVKTTVSGNTSEFEIKYKTIA